MIDPAGSFSRFAAFTPATLAAAAFTPEKRRAAAGTVLTLPGVRLIHEGQQEGRKVRLPVFLARRPRPEESPDSALLAFYRQLLEALRRGDSLRGTWHLSERMGWQDTASYPSLVSWSWQKGNSCSLIAVNLSDAPSKGRVRVPWEDLKGGAWRLRDVFTTAVYERNGDELCGQGLSSLVSTGLVLAFAGGAGPPRGFQVLPAGRKAAKASGFGVQRHECSENE